jgi:iron complex transport system ATP-binding protein
LLDEPTAGLDVPGREYLVRTLARRARSSEVGGIVFVTHHVEEIPAGFDHVLLMRDGRVADAGPIDRLLTDERLSTLFDLPLTVHRVGGRYLATAAD